MDFLDNLVVYTKCWHDLIIFLCSVVSEKPDDYPYAVDVLQLMSKIERKYDLH